MNSDGIKEVISNHSKWLEGKGEGHQADLHKADLHEANLLGVDLQRANLYKANLYKANLYKADLEGANLGEADLRGANLGEADLEGADLEGASLRGANLQGAHLNGANFRWADLSGTKGLLSASDWIKDNFKCNNDGVIVYKIFGLYYSVPSYWTIVPGSVIEEITNPDRSIACGCGVNFGTLKWCQINSRGLLIGTTIWKCLIKWIDLADVVVPYTTDGKARCQRLTLLEKYNSK